MPKPFDQWSWEELVGAAQDGMQGQGTIVEATRRLTESLHEYSSSSDRYSNRMFWLTVAILLLTVIQAVAAVAALKGIH